jgi:hypothetical protein
MLAIGWGLAAAIGSVAGMMAAPIVYLDPNMMGGWFCSTPSLAPCWGGIDNPFRAPSLAASRSACSATSSAPIWWVTSQALGGACDHHRRARGGRPDCSGRRLVARSDSWPTPTARRAPCRHRSQVFALAFPFAASGYHIYQGAQVLILAIAARPRIS